MPTFCAPRSIRSVRFVIRLGRRRQGFERFRTFFHSKRYRNDMGARAVSSCQKKNPIAACGVSENDLSSCIPSRMRKREQTRRRRAGPTTVRQNNDYQSRKGRFLDFAKRLDEAASCSRVTRVCENTRMRPSILRTNRESQVSICRIFALFLLISHMVELPSSTLSSFPTFLGSDLPIRRGRAGRSGGDTATRTHHGRFESARSRCL